MWLDWQRAHAAMNPWVPWSLRSMTSSKRSEQRFGYSVRTAIIPWNKNPSHRCLKCTKPQFLMNIISIFACRMALSKPTLYICIFTTIPVAYGQFICRCCWSFIYYEGHLESKERFAIRRCLLIIGKKQNMQVLWHLHLLLHIVTLDTEALVVPWHQFIYSLLVPDGRLAIHRVALISQRHEHLFARS